MLPFLRCVTTALMVLLSGCAPDLNGHYLGYVSVLFGLLRTRVVLTVDGESATLRWSDGSRLSLHAARHGNRLVLADNHGDTLTFRVVDRGDTLHCAQCRAIQLPETWERQVHEPQTDLPPTPTRQQRNPLL